MGRLTADPELRTTASGVSVARFSIAVDRGYTRPGEEKQTDFINIVAWRQTAEFVSKYFHKGSMIAVQGELRMNKFTDKNGQNRTTYEVMANNISFTGSKAESGSGDFAAPGAQPAASYQNAGSDDFQTVVEDDGFPF
jgi:single-strand DNA-binding protein